MPPAPDLTDRVAVLEAIVARLTVPAPAANPPIVIGPFDNVPAPGSPIRSDWPQEISQWVVDSANQDNARMDAIDQVNNVQTGAGRVYGTTVGVTTNAAGGALITIPAGLLSGVSAAIAHYPDNAGGQPANWLDVATYGTTATGFSIQVAQRGQNAPFANAGIIIQYLVWGPYA